MAKTPEKKARPRAAATVTISLAAVLLSAGLLRALLPDPIRSLFLKAQKLETAGQWSLALRHYAVLTSSHPESYYAPRALERQAAILASLGRPTGDPKRLREAMEIYGRLAETYPESSQAGDALLAAGSIALTDLRSSAEAKKWYSQVLERFPNSREFAPEAMVKLGRIALQQKDREAAQMWFQRVLQRYPQLTERCAEAQYHLGVAYETLWPDAEHKQWARNAYEATFKRYPQTVYAADAKERLGLLIYGDSARQPTVRRVLIDVPPIPAATQPSDKDGGLLDALRVVLAARGIEVDEAVLRGWSLQPFACALDPKRPERVARPIGSAWQNIVANAGLLYAPLSGGREKEALADLQTEIDSARPPLIFHGRWSLAVGFDSSRNQVFLQNAGAQLETLSTRELAQTWKQPAPIGGPFAMISFWARGERPRLAPEARRSGAQARLAATPTPKALDAAPAPAPTATPTPLPRLNTPTYIYELPALSERDAHRRALRRAVSLLKRPRQGDLLLNSEALSHLARELRLCASAPASVAQAEGTAEPQLPELEAAGEVPSSDLQEGSEPAEAQATPTPLLEDEAASGAPPARSLEQAAGAGGKGSQAPQRQAVPPVAIDWARRARSWRGWFGEPLDFWLSARRDAAAYCDAAANSLNERALFEASQALRQSVQSLEAAREAMPPREALITSPLPASTRASLLEASRLLRQAVEAEKKAVAAMSRV
jgi:outer membrane protein assembly factor BamD (BamD/ComL family)